MRRSAVRVEATSAAVGAASTSQSQRNHGRVQHKSHPLGFVTSMSHKQGNACLSQMPGGGGGDGSRDGTLVDVSSDVDAHDALFVGEHVPVDMTSLLPPSPGRVPMHTAPKNLHLPGSAWTPWTTSRTPHEAVNTPAEYDRNEDWPVSA